MRKSIFVICFVAALSCSKIIYPDDAEGQSAPALVSLGDVADILSSVQIDAEQMREVYDAVTASTDNGYDDEYTMSALFSEPGAGVGRERLDTKAAKPLETYTHPLRDVFTSYYSKLSKADGTGGAVQTVSPQQYLDYISRSDMQIYWPFSSSWDGITPPVITFDPLDGSESNMGYYMDEDGVVQSVMVTEALARTRPVWVINNNDDSRHTTIEVMRKNNPDWAAGGTIVVNPESRSGLYATKASASVRSLVMKDMILKRPYDNWFQGASELFIKIGAVESFSASKEEDIYAYNPSVTDFMVVVKRDQIGKPIELNTLLVSEWTSQLQNCAFMIIEDDGGTITSWECNAVVKYNSRSYGFEIKIPYRSRDDIVWRGQLSRKYIEATSDTIANFGEAQITFSIEQL